MELKEKLAELRGQKGLTQDELAQALGVTRQAVSKWERGIISPATVNLAALGRLYGVSLDELVNGEQPPQEAAAAAVAVVKESEAAEPQKKPKLLRLAEGTAAATLILLVVAASVITIVSAVFKEPEMPENGIIWVGDLEGEEINPVEINTVPEKFSGITFIKNENE